MLEVGTIAPEIALNDANGNEVKLSDYKGKKVIVYFYPKDNTPGCTKQAQGFAECNAAIEEKGAVVIGISKDSVASHAKFRDKYALPFILLSDPEKIAIEAFGVWQEKKLYGKVSFGVVRSTFIIDEQGVVEKVYKAAKATENPTQVCKYLNIE
ncbi:MAG: thioredoxin-dependent thiol peroxidase [Bacillota bacterium]